MNGHRQTRPRRFVEAELVRLIELADSIETIHTDLSTGKWEEAHWETLTQQWCLALAAHAEFRYP